MSETPTDKCTPTTDDIVQFPGGRIEDVLSVDAETGLDLVTTATWPDPIPVYLHDEMNGVTRVFRVDGLEYPKDRRNALPAAPENAQ